jgi:hypothetical protein
VNDGALKPTSSAPCAHPTDQKLLFSTAVRYTGSSIAFNLDGIFGASLAPYAATWLAQNYSLHYVGYYISAVATLSLIGLVATRETKDTNLRH